MGFAYKCDFCKRFFEGFCPVRFEPQPRGPFGSYERKERSALHVCEECWNKIRDITSNDPLSSLKITKEEQENED